MCTGHTSALYIIEETISWQAHLEHMNVMHIENGRYGHAPIRSDTSIWVYATADTDTDTSTRCASVPVTYIIIPGISGERSYFTQGSTCRPLATHQLARSRRSVTFTTGQFVETLVWLTVVITACWWGRRVRRHLSLVASTAPLGVGVTGRLVSGYSLPPPTPPTLSRILYHMALPRAAGDPRGEWPARMSFDLLFNATC